MKPRDTDADTDKGRVRDRDGGEGSRGQAHVDSVGECGNDRRNSDDEREERSEERRHKECEGPRRHVKRTGRETARASEGNETG